MIDEAGMVGTRQLERVLSHAAETGAKVVLVGDPRQLQSIEAGAAFRSLHERHGGAKIGEVRRQRADWQREATRDLATGRTGAAIQAYDAHGMVHAAASRDQARADRFDFKDYDRIDHGYAATVHKAQGMTVDRTHVLATPGLDAHGSYVALSRHRDGLELHYGRDDFASQDQLIRTLSRDRSKDMALDYAEADPAKDFAARRGITFRERVIEVLRKVVPERLRDGINGRMDTFPAQLRISVHGAGWRESEINRWVENPVGWKS